MEELNTPNSPQLSETPKPVLDSPSEILPELQHEEQVSTSKATEVAATLPMSVRTRKARLGSRITPQTMQILSSLAVLLCLGGIGLLFLGWATGWLLIGLAGVPCAYALWDKYDLNDISAGQGVAIDQVLESSVLGLLGTNPSPREIANAAMQSSSARFMLVRLGLPKDLLMSMSSDEANDALEVWKTAEAYRQVVGGTLLRGSMLVAALCETQAALKASLPHLQLDSEDLLSGVRWYSRLEQLIESEDAPKRTGGIARDWNFGYANLLERFGHNISQQIAGGGLLHVRLDSHVAILSQLQAIFSRDGRQNVALVGKLGAGKTTLVQAFAESLLAANSTLPSHLKFQQVLKLDAGALISAARNRGELEEIVQHLFVEAYQAKNIILFLDDAELFFEDRGGSVDLATTLMPILDAGRLRLLLSMDEQAYLRIAQRNPGLAAALNRVNVPVATEAETMLVMQDQIIRIEHLQNVVFSLQSLKEAYRLSERYQHDIAQPGRAVQLLEQAARQASQGYVSAESVAAAIEQASGVKVATAADSPQERDTLLHLEDLIHERMINQTRAVKVVSDALRRARAGVRNEKRPMGTFLFLGPTGVGKTELAKALAAVYFGGEDRMIRIDINQFVRPEDVSRLIADGATDPRSLAASVLKQPFSVVLLDEIEKAHPQVLTTLLQMLDEGILRDINNREVSFRDAIVIATSNAGAGRIRELVGQGQALEQFEEQLVNELIDSQEFRPEFLNRFDEIVVFRPLTKEELGQVVDGMIRDVNKTLVPKKIQVTLEPEAVAKLAEIGYDPRLGARPMRRMVQRSVENLVAKKILEGIAQPGDTILITSAEISSGQ